MQTNITVAIAVIGASICVFFMSRCTERTNVGAFQFNTSHPAQVEESK